MPWPSYALDRPENAKLAALCGVSTIPCLVLLDARGEVITTKAADLLRGDPTGADWPYLPKAVEKLTPLAAPIMNTATCCIAFVDGGAGGGVATGEAALKDAAEAEFAKAESQRQTHFYVARSDDEFVQRVMQVRSEAECGLQKSAVQLCALPGLWDTRMRSKLQQSVRFEQ